MSWSKLSSGVGSTVNAIAIDPSGNPSGNVYVGGNFSGYVSSWNGSSWTNIGSSGTTKPNNYCYSIAVDSIGNVYAGGTGSGSGYIYKWNGTVWSFLGPSAPNQTVYTIAYNYSNGLLYAGGDFSQIGGVNAHNIAKWNGTTWSVIDATDNANNAVSAIAVDSLGNVYAGGYFTQIGGNLINYIAKWNGTIWSALGSGVTGGSVNAIAIDSNNNVYAGGNFTGAGGVSGTNCIAKWNTSTNTWSALGTGVSGGNPTVTSIAVNSSGIVYVGGNFTSAGGNSSIQYMAKWDGSIWSSFGTPNSNVNAISLTSSGNMYAGGSFSNIGGLTSVGNIAKWSGNNTGIKSNGVDLINIFMAGTTTNPTNYNVNNGANYINRDLSTIFAPYVSGPQANLTNYKANNSDLSTIFQNINSTSFIPFTFSQGTAYDYTPSLALYPGYSMLRFRIGTFVFTPITNVTVYQLFLVGAGGNGIPYTQSISNQAQGGKGGSVVIPINGPINITPLNTFTITVSTGNPSAGYGNTQASVTGIITTTTATKGAGAAGGTVKRDGTNGTQNIYTGLYYGGGGGGGGDDYSREPAGKGGSGGGGGGGAARIPINLIGGAGGGVGVTSPGGDGGVANGTVDGTNSNFGGGGGGAGGGSTGRAGLGGSGGIGGGNGGIGGGNPDPYYFAGGGGGGGGGGGYYGGGGGMGGYFGGSIPTAGLPGIGGAGTALLIFKINNTN